jgi:predicted TPR repeat methyltransferase
LSIFEVFVQTSKQNNLSPEGLFHHTYQRWMDNGSQGSGLSWGVWTDFAMTLMAEFRKASTKSPTSATKIQQRHLAIIGAMEEGILTIEKFLAEQEQQQQHVPDQLVNPVLADLYVGYGTMLQQLTPVECWKLSSDPHTLLIGAPERLAEFQSKLSEDGRAQDEIQLIRSLFTPLCFDNADNAVRNAMSLDATNTKAIELLEVLTGESDPTLVHQRKPQEFVAELFDSFADTFDDKLVGTLQYRVPQLIGGAVRHILSKKTDETNLYAVMDAGCGTGLAGRQLRPLIQDNGLMVGVDASPKMLKIAAKCTRTNGCGATSADIVEDDARPLYDFLLQMDLEDMTLSNTLNGTLVRGFDLIVAADVLVYFGDLETIMRVYSELVPVQSSSWLVFSCEKATREEAPLGFRLMPSGRFAHTKDHVVAMAGKVGYKLHLYNEIIPRMEKGEPVKGHLFAFEMNRNAMAGENEL